MTHLRTMQDFAHQMRWLVDEAYPEVPVVRLVLDNLNTHRPASLLRDFPGGGGPADCETAGVPLHPEARQLVEHGGDRVQRTVPLLPEATAPRRAGAPAGNPDPGVGAQRRPNHHQLGIQHPGCQDQTSPPLPF